MLTGSEGGKEIGYHERVKQDVASTGNPSRVNSTGNLKWFIAKSSEIFNPSQITLGNSLSRYIHSLIDVHLVTISCSVIESSARV